MKLCPQCQTGYPDSVESCPTHGGMLSEIRELKPGMVIRKTYQIVRKLGQGGMGSVYLARHTLMDEPRALKFLASEFSDDPAFTARFLREVRTLRQVRHRNVVDCGDLEPAEDDSLFFSMEFVDGPDLRGFLRAAPQPFDVPLALEIARGIAEGLGRAHALGLVHRDIKPENILMARVGVDFIPKIADFGIVATKESSSAHTRTGTSLLTPPYAAPEQWRGTRAAELDGRTDLYALGGVLFEMLTGETVFSAENFEGWFIQHLEAAPRAPSSLRPELANWKSLDALVLRLLAKDREQRPRDVAEFLSLLAGVQYVAPSKRRPTVVEPQPPRERTLPDLSPAVVSSLEPSPQPEEKQPRRRFFWVGEAVIAAVVLIVLFFSWQDSQQRPSEPVIDSASQTPVTGQQEAAQQNIAAIEQQAEALLGQKRYKEAAPLFDQACTGGEMKGCNALGLLQVAGHGVAKNYTKAVALFTRGCDGGNAEACYHLGEAYEIAQSVKQDLARAHSLYAKACDSGNGEACENLATAFDTGYGETTDHARAFTLRTRSCGDGYANGCSQLGYMYALGTGVAEDMNKAAELYAKGCDGGDAFGCENIGKCYFNGWGVAKDTDKARELFAKGCSLGSNFACQDEKTAP
jgi:serine/threonine protein kinase